MGAAQAVKARLWLAPVAVMAAMGWARRWTADDGFINLRIVSELVHGHGPVFNPGERVEAGTSTLWVFVLAAVSRLAWFVRLEWVAVVIALLLCVGSFVLAGLAARRLWGVTSWFPLGLVVLVALPPVWDFATSGLEVSLGLFWLALCFWLLVRGRQWGWVAVVVGLGPLVRPDFAIFTVAFLAAVVVSTRRWRVVVTALALPVAYELFRMAYYGALVPNTAFAKEAGRAWWSQGFTYLGDFVSPYWLWLPLVLVAVAFVLLRPNVVAALTAGAGLVHVLYVVRVGGDFMHGRMLLPGLFALLLPVAVVPLWWASAGVAAWAVVAGVHARPHYDSRGFGPHGIADERRVYRLVAGNRHPVTADDYGRWWVRHGRVARVQPALYLEEPAFSGAVDRRLPLAPGRRHSVIVFEFVGMISYSAGPEVTVVDVHGLADPIAARLQPGPRGRPGHEKLLDEAWPVARFADPSAPLSDASFAERVAAARVAVRCGPIGRAMSAAVAPLTLRQAVSNVRWSLTSYGARWLNDPVADREAYCR